MSSNHRVIVLLKNLNVERQSSEAITCILRIGSSTKTSSVPFKEAIIFDLNQIDQNFRIEVTLEVQGRAIANAVINPPTNVQSVAEIEREETISFNVTDNRYRAPLEGQFLTLYLNRQAFQQKTELRSSANKSPIKAAGSRVNTGRTPTQNTTNLQASSSPRRKQFSDDDLTGYLSRVVEKYLQQAKQQLDNKDIEDCLYINNFNRIIQSNPNVGELGVSLSGSQQIDYEIKQRLDVSPESLRNKYDSPDRSPSRTGRSASPSKRTLNKSVDISGMVMDAETRRHVNEYKNQIEYLRLIIYALDMKLKDYEATRSQNQLLELEKQKSEEARRELQQTILETTEEMKREAANNAKIQSNLINERNQLVERLKELQQKLDDSNDRFDKSEHEKNRLEMDVAELQLKVRLMNDLKAQLDFHKLELINSERKRIEIQDTLIHKIREMDGQIEETKNTANKAFNERTRLNEEINRLNLELTKEKHRNATQNAEIDSLNRKLGLQDLDREVLKNIQEQRDQLLKELEDQKNREQNIAQIIENLKAELTARSKEHELNEKRYYDQNKILQARNLHFEDKINQLTDQLNQYIRANSELKSNVSSLEQLLVVKEDVSSQLAIANDKLIKVYKEKDHLKHELDMGANYVISQDEKNYDLQKIIIYLKNVIGEKDDYIDNLKKLILEMKEKTNIYIPISSDPIDSRLADYLNSIKDENKLRILFIREGEGVYRFGQRKVYVKIEQDKIYIRVGGGFMHIDEFLEQYVPLELDKARRVDPVDILTKNIAVNKTISGRSVNTIEKAKTVAYQTKNFSPVISKVSK